MCSAAYNAYVRMPNGCTASHTELRSENKDNLFPLLSEWLQFSVTPIQDYSGEDRKHIAMQTVSSMQYIYALKVSVMIVPCFIEHKTSSLVELSLMVRHL